MPRIFIAAVIVLIAGGTASAETYKWIDNKGTINFTEDYSSIPKKYRKKARMIGDVGASSREGSTTESGAETKKDQTGNASTIHDETGSSGKQEKKSVTYDGKSADQWKDEFRKMNADIKSLEEQIAGRRNKLNNTEKLTRAQYLDTQYQIKDLEKRLEELRINLSELDAAASRAGVPFELRR